MVVPVTQYGFDSKIPDRFWNEVWIPAFALGTRQSVWPKALAYYAEHSKDAAQSIELLEKIRGMMIENGADPKHRTKPFESIDAAIETLSQRR